MSLSPLQQVIISADPLIRVAVIFQPTQPKIEIDSIFIMVAINGGPAEAVYMADYLVPMLELPMFADFKAWLYEQIDVHYTGVLKSCH